MISLLVAVLVLCFYGITVLAVRIDRAGGPRYELSPSLIFYSAFAAYALAMPLSRILFATQETSNDLDYLSTIGATAASMALGAVTAALCGFYRRPRVLSTYLPVSPVAASALAWSALVVHLFVWMAGAGFSYGRLLSAYGTGDKRYDETTILETGAILFAVGANWVASWCGFQRSTKRTHKLLLLMPAFLLLLFAVLRGNRNIALILALPVCVNYLRGRRLRIGVACTAAVLAYLGLYLVGVIRNVGFAEVGRLQIGSSSFDPLNGELGTIYGVHEKTGNTSLFDNEWWLGRSYLVDPVVNLVPRQLWAERPLTVAQAASFAYYGGGKVGFGIGFSPIIEARLNFGPVGCMMLFAVLPILIALMERSLDKPNGLAVLCYGAAAPMLVNFWRIDFATASKMLLLFLLALAACARLVIGRQGRSVQPRSRRIPTSTASCIPAVYPPARSTPASTAPCR